MKSLIGHHIQNILKQS